MRRRHAIRVLAGTAALALAIPAAAATAADTEVTLQVTEADASALSISVADTTASLGEITASWDDQVVETDLPNTTVTDERGDDGASWAVQVAAAEEDFAGPGGGSIGLQEVDVYIDSSIADALLDGTSGLLNGMTVDSAYDGGGSEHLGTPYELISGTTDGSLFGDLTAAPSVEYTPTFRVTVPGGTPPDTYTVTVQQTVS